MTPTLRRALVLALAVAFIGPSVQVLYAQAAQLTWIGHELRSLGFVPVREAAGSLRHGQSQSHWFSLAPDTEYIFAGTCDRDCTDLDFDLYDGAGHLVDRDTLVDAVPEVGVITGRGGLYRLQVTMYACSINPCAYLVGVYAR
jgi:hypothetical protein